MHEFNVNIDPKTLMTQEAPPSKSYHNQSRQKPFYYWNRLSLNDFTLLATVNELAGVDALSSDEELGPFLEAVRVPEGHLGQGSAPAGVVDNILQNKHQLNQCVKFSTRRFQIRACFSTFTMPLMYPWRSAKSICRSLAAPFRCLTWALKTEPAPFLCPLITRPMVNWRWQYLLYTFALNMHFIW